MGISGLHDHVQNPLYRISNSRTLFAMGTDEAYMGDHPGGSWALNDYGYALMTERFGTQANVFKNENVFTDLFTRNNQNLDQNTETIWAIQFEPDILDGDNYMGSRGWAFWNRIRDINI